MKVNIDHWLDGVTRDFLPGGMAMTIRRFLVIHFTAGATGSSSIGFWKSKAAKGACAQLVIERDGSVTQCRPFNRTCGHAGKSRWAGFSGLNSCSIGIELANAGDDPGALSWARKQKGFASMRAAHKNGGGVAEWECYTPAQIQTLKLVSKALVDHYNLDDLVGHEDIAPDRKNDPGPLFPMQQLREFCGFKGLPKPWK